MVSLSHERTVGPYLREHGFGSIVSFTSTNIPPLWNNMNENHRHDVEVKTDAKIGTDVVKIT